VSELGEFARERAFDITSSPKSVSRRRPYDWLANL
jgi:hypothetical protein